jgi:3-mercaptopyruvate sulfurtransferase SseA
MLPSRRGAAHYTPLDRFAARLLDAFGHRNQAVVVVATAKEAAQGCRSVQGIEAIAIKSVGCIAGPRLQWSA